MQNAFRNSACLWIAVTLLCLNSACATAPRPLAAVGLFGGWKSAAEGGEAQPGYGGQLVVGAGDAQNSVLGLAGITRLNFTGGYDRFFSIGGQYRRSLSLIGPGAPWVGAEATFIHETSVLEWPGGNPTGKGYTLGGLLGYRLPTGSIKVSIFSGVSYFHIGDFAVDGVAAWPGSNHVLLRGGLELQIK